MMNNELQALRRENLVLLETHFKSGLLQELLGCSRQTLSQLRTGSREITNDRARQIELATKFDQLWLDEAHPEGILASERPLDKQWTDKLKDTLIATLRKLPAKYTLQIYYEIASAFAEDIKSLPPEDQLKAHGEMISRISGRS